MSQAEKKVRLCAHCNMDIEIRNPSGFCDHLYYPDSCGICELRNMSKEERIRRAAPELLEALKIAESQVRGFALIAIKNALAKAEGRE